MMYFGRDSYTIFCNIGIQEVYGIATLNHNCDGRGYVMTKRKKKKNGRNVLYIVIAVAFLLCTSLGVHCVALSSEVTELNEKQEELAQKKEELFKEKESISEEKEYMQTNEYVEDVAREKLGLVYEDEIVFKAN